MWDEASPYGDVVLETNGSGSTLASYVLGGTQLISQTRGATTNYFLQDGQNSTRALTNSSGNVTDTYSYTAFGELQSQTGSTTNSYLYTGQQFDSLTGLYDLRARYYNPALGRFLSQDTYPYNFSNPVELNRYIYAANNPINLIDPTGNTALPEYSLLTFEVAGGMIGAGQTFICGGSVGDIIENAALGALLGFDFAIGMLYYPLVTNAVGFGLSGIGAKASINDVLNNGLNACNGTNAAMSLMGMAFSAHGFVKEANSGSQYSPYKMSFVREWKDFGMTIKTGRAGPLTSYGNMLFPELGESSIVNGRAYYANQYAHNRFIWVQELDGTIRFTQDLTRGQGGFDTIHPMLSRGQPVWSAGEMMFKDGQLQWINNGSGHFLPKLIEVYGVRDTLVHIFGLSGPAEVVPVK